MSNEYHITSFVVHSQPDRVSDVRAAIHALEGSEIHSVTDSGKLVVTLERSSQGAMRSAMDRLVNLDGVLSAALTYHRVETLDEQEEAKQ
ncbi:chaperone NapD [Ferrimonas pelagia]|uniref:Chaperone NapD n=1 Tax=Ferrimonas pelagia TaxID=1177826 RepID=A0ABP9FAE3_9GAMM